MWSSPSTTSPEWSPSSTTVAPSTSFSFSSCRTRVSCYFSHLKPFKWVCCLAILLHFCPLLAFGGIPAPFTHRAVVIFLCSKSQCQKISGVLTLDCAYLSQLSIAQVNWHQTILHWLVLLQPSNAPKEKKHLGRADIEPRSSCWALTTWPWLLGLFEIVFNIHVTVLWAFQDLETRLVLMMHR